MLCAAQSRGHSWHVTLTCFLCSFPPSPPQSQWANQPPCTLRTEKYVYIHIVMMFPICGAFSIVSKATVLKFVWLISIHPYNGLGIFDSEICNKRCFFLTKEQRLFLWLLFFWLSYISSDNKYLAGFFLFYYGIWAPLLFPHSFARCFLRTVPVMLPEGLSRGRRTCVGNDVSKAVICVGAFV